MKKVSFLIFTFMLCQVTSAKVEKVSDMKAKESGFLIRKVREREQLKRQVKPDVYSVLEVGSCEEVKTKDSNGKFDISIVVKYRLCQHVEYYRASDISYFGGLIKRSNVHSEEDYVLTKYEEQERAKPKVFYVGKVNFKSMKKLERVKNRLYRRIENGSDQSSSDLTLADIARDEDLLVNLMSEKKNDCQAFIENLKAKSTEENFCN